MAYISASEVKRIREALKMAFPDFKFSVRKLHSGSSVQVKIVSGPIDLRDDCYHGKGHGQLNQYRLDYYENTGFYEAIQHIIKNAPLRKHYDESDAQTDYFNCAYYYRIHIGEWDKPYEIKMPKRLKGEYVEPDYMSEANNALAFTEMTA